MNKVKYLLSRISFFYWRYVVSPEKYARHIGVKIGKHCFISTREWSSEPFLISIGNNVQVTRGVFIHTHGGGHCIRKEHPDFDIFGKVIIEDWAYIGSCAHIMPGVTIGEGSLVAACSVVTKSVPPHTVVAGNPAQVICTTEQYFERNNKYNIMTRNVFGEEKKHILLSLPDEKFLKK